MWPLFTTRGPPNKVSILLDTTCFSTTDLDSLNDFQVSQDHPLPLLPNLVKPPNMQNSQYFTLLHEFWRILPESHGMLEFHWECAGMVGMYHSRGFPWIPSGIPGKFHGNSRMISMDSQWNSSGISMEIPPKFQNDSKWNLNGIPLSSKFNQCKNRVQYQYILKTYLSGSHMGQVQT